jgi:hypothetical protein
LDYGKHGYSKIDETTHLPIEVAIRAPSMLVGVRLTTLTSDTLDEARANLKALIGALATRIDSSVFNAQVYENFVEVTKDGRMRFAASRQNIDWQTTKSSIEERLNDLKDLKLSSLPVYAVRGAEWLGKAIEEDGYEAKFTCLWLALLSIIDGWSAANLAPPTGQQSKCCTTSGDWPVRKKIREYVQQRLGLGGPEESEVFDALDRCYSLRHLLLKGARSDTVSESQMVEAANLATRLVSVELGSTGAEA